MIKHIVVGITSYLIVRSLFDVKFKKQLIHNALVHPCMMLLPKQVADKLHDTNADWAFN